MSRKPSLSSLKEQLVKLTPPFRVQTHLAALTVPLASHFLADLARQRLQRTLDNVNERMATEGGVLWTSSDTEKLKQ